jgi:hypothetical protein
MPALLSPKPRWAAKPTQLAVDWASPLSDRLVRAYLFHEAASGLGGVMDLCGTAPAVGLSNTTTQIREDEPGLVGRSTGGGWSAPDADDLTPGTGVGQGWSVVAGVWKESAGVPDQIASRYQTGSLEWIFGFTTTALQGWVADNAVTAASGRSMTAPSAGVWHDLVFTWDGELVPKDHTQLWVDGVRGDTADVILSTVTQVRNTAIPLDIGRGTIGTGGTTGLRYRYLYLFRRGLLPDEIGTLADHPYTLLRETCRRLPRLQSGTSALHLGLELITVDAVLALEAHAPNHVTLTDTTDDVTVALAAHVPERTMLALPTEDVTEALAVHLATAGALVFMVDDTVPALAAHLTGQATLALTTEDVSAAVMAHSGTSLHVMVPLTTDDVTVALAGHVLTPMAAVSWLDAAAHAATLAQTSGQYQPVLFVDFPAFSRRFTTHPMLFSAEEPWLARLTDGGVGAITRTLDEGVDTVRLGGSSVVLVNEDGFVDTFLQAPFLNTPVEIRLGFVDLAEADFLLLFTGVIDRYALTRPHMEFALLDASVKDSVNLNVPISPDLFPNAPSASRQQHIPIFLGVHVNAPVIQVSGVAATGTLSFALTATSTSLLLLETTAAFPDASTVIVGAESLAYTHRALVSLGGQTYVELSGLTRTAPVTHASGTGVTLTDLRPAYVTGFGVDAVNAVRVAGVALLPTQLTITVLLITGHPVPVIQLLVTPDPLDVVTVDVNAAAPLLPFSVSLPPESLGGSQLVTNGGFETGDLSGWTAAGVGPVAAVRPAGVAPAGSTGGFAVELQGDAFGTAKQLWTDITTMVGARYAWRVRYYNVEPPPFWGGPLGFVRDKSQASLAIGTPASPFLDTHPLRVTQGWVTASGTFLATDTSTRLTLSAYMAATFALLSSFFDDVSVLAAPLPPTGNQLLNGDFEVGDTSGWTTAGTVEEFVVSDGSVQGLAPFDGTYLAVLQGGWNVDGSIYQDVVTVVGEAYDYSARAFNRFGTFIIAMTLYQSASVARLSVGTPAVPDLYASTTSVGSQGGWGLAAGTFVATTTLTRITLSSQYTTTYLSPDPFPSFFDAVSLLPHVTVLPGMGQPILYQNDGENPVDAILYLLALFYPQVAYDAPAFATARALLSALKFRGLLTNPGASGTLLQRMGQQCKSLVSYTPSGAVTITVLDSSRPVLAAFDPTNILPNTFARSSVPVDALYTHFDVYFDTRVGGSTTPGDYAGVASCTPTSTTVPDGAALVAACLAASQLYGREQRYTFFADFVRDVTTANQLLAWLVSRHAVRQDTLALTSWLDAVPLQLGQVVRVTHPVLSHAGATVEGEVIAWQYLPGAMQVALTVRTFGASLDVGMAIPEAPVAHDDVGTTFLNTPVVLDILFNDVAALGAMLNPASVDLDPGTAGQQTTVTDPGHGTFVVAPSGLVTFTPVTDYAGEAVASYTVQDNFGSVSNSALITVTVQHNLLALTTADVTLALAVHGDAMDGQTVLALPTEAVTVALAVHIAQTALALTTEGVADAFEVHLEGEGSPETPSASCGWTLFMIVSEPADNILDTGLHIFNGFEAFYDPGVSAYVTVTVTGDPEAPGATGTVSSPGLNDITLASRLLAAPLHAAIETSFQRTSYNGMPHEAASGNPLTALVAVKAYGDLLYVAFNTADSSDTTVSGAPVIFTLANLTDYTEDTFVDTWVETHGGINPFSATYRRIGCMLVYGTVTIAQRLFVALEPVAPGTGSLDLWALEATTWSLNHSFGTSATRLRSLCAHANNLYAGVDGVLWEYDGVSTWTSRHTFTGVIDALVERDGTLWINVRNGSTREIWRTPDVSTFTLSHTFTDDTSTLDGCMALGPGTLTPALDGAADGVLYVSTRTTAGDTQVWLYDGATWTVSMDFGAGFLGVSAMGFMPDTRLYTALSRHRHTVSPESASASAEIWYWSCYLPSVWALTYDLAVVDFTSLITDVLPPPPDADIDVTTLTLDQLVFPEIDLTLSIGVDGVITGTRTAPSFGGPFSTTYHFTDSLARAWSGTFQITFITG